MCVCVYGSPWLFSAIFTYSMSLIMLISTFLLDFQGLTNITIFVSIQWGLLRNDAEPAAFLAHQSNIYIVNIAVNSILSSLYSLFNHKQCFINKFISFVCVFVSLLFFSFLFSIRTFHEVLHRGISTF